jgi:hypothetical protein
MTNNIGLTLFTAGLLAAAVLFVPYAPSAAQAKTPAPVAAAPMSSNPSAATQIETWTTKQWDAAKHEWAKDKTKWADCEKQSDKQRLEGRKSWSFLYKCMTT